jgi:hypothetical protein
MRTRRVLETVLAADRVVVRAGRRERRGSGSFAFPDSVKVDPVITGR